MKAGTQAAQPSKPTDGLATPPVLSRVERKRQLARARIIEAAEALMQTRAIDDITIADITSAADIGHGSFYLHFKTKHDVLKPIAAQYAASLDARFRDLTLDIVDPAAVIALSARLMAREMINSDIWRWYLHNAQVPYVAMAEAFGKFARRDYARGLASGRFSVPDRRVGLDFAFSGFVNTLMTSFDLQHPYAAIDTATELMLRVLGLPRDEAHKIAHSELPSLPPDSSGRQSGESP